MDGRLQQPVSNSEVINRFPLVGRAGACSTGDAGDALFEGGGRVWHRYSVVKEPRRLNKLPLHISNMGREAEKADEADVVEPEERIIVRVRSMSQVTPRTPTL